MGAEAKSVTTIPGLTYINLRNTYVDGDLAFFCFPVLSSTWDSIASVALLFVFYTDMLCYPGQLGQVGQSAIGHTREMNGNVRLAKRSCMFMKKMCSSFTFIAIIYPVLETPQY